MLRTIPLFCLLLCASLSAQLKEGAMSDAAAGALNKKHERLAWFLGEWETETQVWMQPGSPPMSMKGQVKASWLFEGRWLRMDVSGKFFGVPTKSGHGHGLRQLPTSLRLGKPSTALSITS